MINGENQSLEDYRQLEMQFHLELMNCCRKYINQLGIVSIIGIIDIVKLEAKELEKATRKTFEREKLESDEGEKTNLGTL